MIFDDHPWEWDHRNRSEGTELLQKGSFTEDPRHKHSFEVAFRGGEIQSQELSSDQLL
jgi:hypothetical protein